MEEKAEPDHPEQWMIMRGPNQYPLEMPGMQAKVEQYMKNLGEVGEVIMRSYAKGLNMPEDFFTKHFKRPSSLLRLIKYPPTEGGSQGIGEHADYGFLTLIDQDDVGGL